MDRHPGRLVDDQQVLVFVEDRAGDELLQRVRGLGLDGLFVQSYGWDAYLIAQHQPGLGLGALAIDPHLALAQHPVNMAFGHGLEHPHQVVVEALPRIAFLRLDMAHPPAERIDHRSGQRVRRLGFRGLRESVHHTCQTLIRPKANRARNPLNKST